MPPTPHFFVDKSMVTVNAQMVDTAIETVKPMIVDLSNGAIEKKETLSIETQTESFVETREVPKTFVDASVSTEYVKPGDYAVHVGSQPVSMNNEIKETEHCSSQTSSVPLKKWSLPPAPPCTGNIGRNSEGGA